MKIDDLIIHLQSIKEQLGNMDVKVQGQLIKDFEDSIQIDESLYFINFIKFEIDKVKCNHRDYNGILTIQYDSSYEMRSSDMYCVQCGKQGSRQEFEKKLI